jgi:hypothetical protein
MYPPPELLRHWEDQHFDEGENYDVMLTQAYQAGADHELEACCAEVSFWGSKSMANNLRESRRPKSLSLKEQALQALCRFQDSGGHDNCDQEEIQEDYSIIRRAIESLSDD